MYKQSERARVDVLLGKSATWGTGKPAAGSWEFSYLEAITYILEKICIKFQLIFAMSGIVSLCPNRSQMLPRIPYNLTIGKLSETLMSNRTMEEQLAQLHKSELEGFQIQILSL